MTRNILESDEVDSKIFAGRVITLLGEIIAKQDAFQKALDEALYLPPSDSPTAREMQEEEEAGFSDPDEEL